MADPDLPPPMRTVETDWTLLSDEELALRCSTQLAGCMDELVCRYDQRVRDCARRMAMNRQDAEDLVQEIFLRMAASISRFRGRSAFATWMYRLAHNTCIDAFRKAVKEDRRRLSSVPEGEVGDPLENLASGLGDPEAELDAGIQECYVGRALASLPEGYRKIVRLRLAEGRSNEEVAGMLGTTVDSVKSKLRRARKLLRAWLLEQRSCPFCGALGPLRIEPSGEIS